MSNPKAPTYSNRKEHVAVVVLCDKADAASLRTVSECITHFSPCQVYAVYYGSQGSALDMKNALLPKEEPVSLSNGVANFIDVTPKTKATADKRKVLKEILTSNMIDKRYTHILVVNAQAGARKELLSDTLSQKISLPTTVYYTKPTPAEAGAAAAPSNRQRRKLSLNFFMSTTTSTTAAANSPAPTLGPVFAELGNKAMPNHFMDLWEREVLVGHVVTCKVRLTPSDVTSTAKPLGGALAASAPPKNVYEMILRKSRVIFGS